MAKSAAGAGGGAQAEIALRAVAIAGNTVKQTFNAVAHSSRTLAAAISPFVKEVGKWNPGTIDRMNLAFDNLAAATGRIFEPLVIAVTSFANELNRAFTAIGPPIRAVVDQFAGLATSVGREIFAGLFEIIQAGVPIVSQFMEDLRPFAPIARELFRGLIDVTKWLMEFYGSIYHVYMNFVAPLVDAWRPLVVVAREGFRIFESLWDIANKLLEPFTSLLPTTGRLVSVIDIAVDAIREFAAGLMAGVHVFNVLLQNPAMLQAANLQGIGNAWNAMREVFLARMQAPAQLPGQGGPMTIAAQPARHVGIEDVGLEARRQAFSQGQDVQQQQLEAQQNAARILEQNLPQIVRLLANMGQNFALPPIGLN